MKLVALVHKYKVRYKIALVGSLVFLIILPSCYRDKAHQSAKSAHYKTKKKVVEQEAQLIDVPVPIGSQLVNSDAQEGLFSLTTLLTYKLSLAPDRVAAFYQQEMERLGWQYGARFSGAEWLLYFEKPDRFCVISLRPVDKRQQVLVIITGRKELGYS